MTSTHFCCGIMQNIIDALFTTFTIIAKCVETVIDAANFTINLNNKIVAAVVESVISVSAALVTLYNHIKPFFTSCVDILIEVYCSITLMFSMLFKFVQLTINTIQSCISNFILSCQMCFHYIISAYLFLKYCIDILVDFVTTFLQNGIGALLSCIMCVSLAVTTVGNICVNFVTGVWQGLGFVLSSVAYFPVYCIQCIDDFLENSWRNLTETCVHILNTTTKENCLGIVFICLLYLALSNTFKFMNSRGLTLFPHRFGSRNRRERRTTQNWNFDRGFESDFEDLYGSDAEDGTWTQEMNQTNNSDSNSSDDESMHSSSHSSGISESDTDEYTIVSDESDSDASINSQTFSTESSDHEIEVQLPQVDERYSLRNRSSTPSHMPKAVSTPEDFDREMEKERDKRKCVICQDEIKSVLVLPCKHLCMCVLCADQIVRSNITGRRVCPLCRSKITKVMNIYV